MYKDSSTLVDMAGGSVEKLLDMARPGEKEWVRLVSAVVAAAAHALKVVHENGYVHNDVKPANILLSNPVPRELRNASRSLVEALTNPGRAKVIPKLSDLGVASRKGELVKGFTPLYAAPEILLYEATCLSGTAGDAELCAKPLLSEPSQDIYSLGVVALQLLTGARKKLLSSYMQLVHSDPGAARKLLAGKASQEIIELVVEMLSLEPSRRPSAARVAEVFSRYALGP
jgi:serine/threonine protein kinase